LGVGVARGAAALARRVREGAAPAGARSLCSAGEPPSLRQIASHARPNPLALQRAGSAPSPRRTWARSPVRRVRRSSKTRATKRGPANRIIPANRVPRSKLKGAMLLPRSVVARLTRGLRWARQRGTRTPLWGKPACCAGPSARAPPRPTGSVATWEPQRREEPSSPQR
jgi:hypothetical protein